MASVEKLSDFSKARVLPRFKGGSHFDWTVTKYRVLLTHMAPANFKRGNAIEITHLRNTSSSFKLNICHDCQVILIKKCFSKSFWTFLSIWSPSAVAVLGLYLVQITPTVVWPCRKDWLQISLFWYEIPAKSIAHCIHNDLPVLWALKFRNCYEYLKDFLYTIRNAFKPPITYIHNSWSIWRTVSCMLLKK